MAEEKKNWRAARLATLTQLAEIAEERARAEMTAAPAAVEQQPARAWLEVLRELHKLAEALLVRETEERRLAEADQRETLLAEAELSARLRAGAARAATRARARPKARAKAARK